MFEIQTKQRSEFMALPRCPNQDCPTNKTTARAFFQFYEDKPMGSNHPLYLIQCSRCGTVIGYKDIKHTQYYVEQLIDITKDILTRISLHPFDNSLSQELYNINQNLEKIFSVLKLNGDIPTEPI